MIKLEQTSDEIEAIGAFAALVNEGRITPAQGLLDAVNKRWNWANDMVKLIQRGTLRTIFISQRGAVVRHILSLPNYKERNVAEGSKTLHQQSSNIEYATDYRRLTLPNRNYFNTIVKKCT